jgi:subtilisin family serine protease
MQSIEIKKRSVLMVIATAAISISGCVDSGDEAGTQIEPPRTIVNALEAGQGVDVIVEFSMAPELTLSQNLERPSLSLQQVQLPVRRTFERLPVATSRLSTTEDLTRLLSAPGVVAVHVDERLPKHAIDAATFIHQPEAINRGFDGSGTAIAVLDTGVDLTRAAFGACSSAGGQGCKVVFEKDFAPEDNDHDIDGHGTNVAGAVLQVAPGADIIALDVFDGDTARSSDVLAAIDWVILNRQTYNISAINLSMGSGKFATACSNSVFSTAITTARQQGVLTISSSGNDGYTDGIGQPACAPDAVSVGAVYDRDMGPRVFSSCADTSTGPDKVACFSNTADYISIMAPGVSIQAAGISMSGTSQAAPLVAGAVAVLRSAYPNETIEQIADRLIDRAPDINEARVGRQLPRVDLEASLDPLSVECEVSFSAERIVASPQGGTYTVDVQTGAACDWIFGKNVGWIDLKDNSGTGPGTITVVIEPNAGSTRGAMISSNAGASIPVVQQKSEDNAPEGFISIDFGSAVTRSSWLTLETTITSDHNVTEMCVGVGARCENWQPFAPVTLVEVPDSDGWKFLRVWVRDDQGYLSDAMEEHIILDRTRPIDGSARISPGVGAVTIQWSQALEFGSGVMFYRVVARDGSMPRDCEVEEHGRHDDREGEEVRHRERNQLVYQGLSRSFVDVRPDKKMRYYRVCAMDYAFNMSSGKTVAGGAR